MYLTSPRNKYGSRTVIMKIGNEYIEANGNEVIILTPIKPIQGAKQEKKIRKYLKENYKKITDKYLIGPIPVSGGHFVYKIMEI